MTDRELEDLEGKLMKRLSRQDKRDVKLIIDEFKELRAAHVVEVKTRNGLGGNKRPIRAGKLDED